MGRPPIYPFALVLGLVTAIALLRFAELLAAGPSAGEVAPGDGDAALVRGFYDAVNATLETGQSTEFDRLLAADFVVHGGPVGRPPTDTGFVRHLVSLHAVYPTMRLLPQDMTARGDLVVVRVRVEGVTSGAFLNLPVSDQPPPWGSIDIFRIARGAIVEYWGGQDRTPVLEILEVASLVVPSSDLQTIWLERTTLVSGGEFTLRTGLDPEALFLEAGHLTVAVTSSAVRGQAAPGVETKLNPGDILLLPGGVNATARDDIGGGATFVTIALRKPGGSTKHEDPSAGMRDVTTIELAGVPLVALPSGPAVLGLGHATIAPGAHSRSGRPGRLSSSSRRATWAWRGPTERSRAGDRRTARRRPVPATASVRGMRSRLVLGPIAICAMPALPPSCSWW